MLFKRFARNPIGRDYIVGDVHGHFTKLQAALDAIGFEPRRDRLFSVGDLVDRGPESEDAREWLAKLWFHAVRGNHEQMAIDAAAGMYDPSMYRANGGAWFMALPKEHQRYFAYAFSALPIAIELETLQGHVGIVHADAPVERWERMDAQLNGMAAEPFAQLCMWSRDRIESAFGAGVQGVRAVVVGHTPVERFTSLGNVLYIDTGAWLPAHRGPRDFTILDAETLQPMKLPAARELEWS